MPISILTDLAEAKIGTAAGSEEQVAISHVALGDGGGAAYDPTHDQTALVNEMVRLPIDSRVKIDTNSWRVRVEFDADTIAVDVREIGFFDSDGDLIAIWGGVDVVARQTGVVSFLIDHVLNFSNVADGVVIVEAPDDELFEHALVDVEGHARIFEAQVDERFARREAQAQLAARDAAVAALAPVGMVAPFARVSTPAGWLPCDGREVSRADYAALFAAVGVAFGVGDGANTFNLPDLRGEFVRGWDRARGADPGRGLGTAQGDAIRNITGSFQEILYQADGAEPTSINAQGAIGQDTSGGDAMRTADTKADVAGGATHDKVTFDASRVVPTANENRPRNVALNYCIRV